MSDKIRSALSPKFGDEWDRIFGPKEEYISLCGQSTFPMLDASGKPEGQKVRYRKVADLAGFDENGKPYGVVPEYSPMTEEELRDFPRYGKKCPPGPPPGPPPSPVDPSGGELPRSSWT
jgi:hypothetical protein